MCHINTQPGKGNEGLLGCGEVGHAARAYRVKNSERHHAGKHSGIRTNTMT